MKIIVFQMGYRANQVLTSLLSFKYCYGPPYHRIKKSLSLEHKKQLEWLKDQCNNVREIYREKNPGLYQKYPLSDDEANRILDFEATPLDLQLLSVALKETIIESTDEFGQKDLEIITTYTLKDVKDVLEVIQKAMNENHIDEFVA